MLRHGIRSLLMWVDTRACAAIIYLICRSGSYRYRRHSGNASAAKEPARSFWGQEILSQIRSPGISVHTTTEAKQ